MPASKVKDRPGKRERELVAEIRTLKSRLARLERQQGQDPQDQAPEAQALHESEARARALLNAIPDMMYRFRGDGTIVDFKAGPEHLLVPPGQVIGVNIMDMPIPQDVRERVLRAIIKSVETGELQEFECKLDMPGGVRIYENRYIKSGDNEAVGIVRDVTEHRQVQQELRGNEQKYRQLVETLDEGIWQIDAKGYSTFVNPKMAKILGYTVEEMKGQHLFAFMDDEQAEEAKQRIELRRQGVAEQHEFVFRKKDGKPVNVLINTSPILDRQGNYIGALASVADITERKQIEEDMRQARTELERFFALVPDMVCMASADGYFKKLNKAWTDTLGFTEEELLGQPFSDFIHPDDLESTFVEVEGQLAGGHTANFVNRYRTKQGQYRWFEWMATPAEGNLLFAAARDITQRKQAEERLKEQHTIFNHLLEKTLAGYWDWRIQDNTEYLSPTFKKMFGYEDHELANAPETWQALINPEDLPGVVEVFQRHVDSRGRVPFYNEVRYRHRDGSTVWVICTGQVTEWGEQGEPIRMIGCHVDITTRKQAEERLKTQQYYLEKAQEIGRIGTWELDLRQNVLKWTDENYRVFGVPIGTELTYEIFLGCVHPDDRAYVHEKWSAALQHEPYDIEHRLIADGQVKWVREKAEVAFDENGSALKAIGFTQDITERKQAEQKLLDNQAQLKSLASELVLAEERERNRIAVHLHDDVCQNLAYAKMRLQMVSGSLDDQAQIEDMTEASDTLTRMMQEVRTLTFELSPPILTEFGLEAAISHWLTEQVEQKHGIATEFTDDGQTKPLEEDIRALLFRSVRELLVNVVKHSQAQRVDVSVSREEGQILIRLQDDGIGFVRDKVVVGQRTGGFGLFSIRERLSQMGGSLEIDSSPGQGCRSLLRAPLQQA